MEQNRTGSDRAVGKGRGPKVEQSGGETLNWMGSIKQLHQERVILSAGYEVLTKNLFLGRPNTKG